MIYPFAVGILRRLAPFIAEDKFGIRVGIRIGINFEINKRTECEPSQLVAAEGIAVANAANKQCSTASLSVNMARGRMIGAAVAYS